jgi:hypothetical protein
MVTKKSTTMMDEMFASRFLDYKSRVLRVFLDYLVGEEKRIIEREKGMLSWYLLSYHGIQCINQRMLSTEVSKDNTAVDLTKLLGNASEMAELRFVLHRVLPNALLHLTDNNAS